MNKQLVDSIVNSMEVKNRATMAKRLGISRSLIAHWETGVRPVQPAMAKKIELETNGKIKREVIRPDIFL